MSIHLKHCKKCGKGFDTGECPYCQEEELKKRKKLRVGTAAFREANIL